MKTIQITVMIMKNSCYPSLVQVISIIIAFPLVMVKHQEMVDRRDHDVELFASYVLDQVFIVGRRLATVLNF